MFITLSVFVWSLDSSNKFLDLPGIEQEKSTASIKTSDKIFCMVTTIYFISTIIMGGLLIV